MRNDLAQVTQIENYLFDQLDKVSRLAFEKKMALDPEFDATVRAQQKAYLLIHNFYHRQEQLNAIFQSLMNEPTFSSQIKTLFA